MNSKSSAKQELLEILLKKYPNSRKIIEVELEDFLANKTRLTVKDLDQLEENIKKLSGWKRPNRLVNTSMEKPIEIQADTLRGQSPKPILCISPYKVSLGKSVGKKIVEKSRDHILFPTDTSVQESLSFSNSRKIKDHDDWGKIVYADHLRYLSEERLTKQEKKNKQALYRNFLISQMALKSSKKDTPEEILENPGHQMERKKKLYKEKEWLDEIIKRKKEEQENSLKAKLKEQQEMRDLWAKQEEAECRQQAHMRKIREKVAKEQYLQASARKKTNFILKEYDRTHSKSLIEENIQKLRDVELKKIDFINKRLHFVHDDERLKKLVKFIQLPKVPIIRETSNSPDIFQTLYESKSPISKNNKYLTDLQEQINEKKLRELEYIKIQREQGVIWAENDQEALKADVYKKLVRKNTQKSLRAEYDAKIVQKKEEKNKDLQLSISEVGMNKKLFQSSLALLSPPHSINSHNVLNN